MKRERKLRRLVRVRRAQRAAARQAGARAAAETAWCRAAAEDLARDVESGGRDLASPNDDARSAAWWRSAAAGVTRLGGALREARDTLSRAEHAEAAALDCVLEARRRLRGVELLAERAGRRVAARAARASQRELDDWASRRRGRQRLAALLGACVLAVAGSRAVAEPAETEALPQDHGISRLLGEIRARHHDLDLREREILDRERQVAELERTVTARLAEIENLATAVETRIGDWELAHRDKSISRLAKVYGSMAPGTAADLLEQLELDLATRIVNKMKPKQSAALLPLLSQRRALAMSRNVAHPLGGPPGAGGS